MQIIGLNARNRQEALVALDMLRKCVLECYTDTEFSNEVKIHEEVIACESE